MRALFLVFCLLFASEASAQAPGAYVPCSGGNDTTALQTAFNACRASATGCRIWLDACTYKVDALNATSITGMELNCMPNTTITAPYMTVSAPILDMLNSANNVVRNCSFIHSGAIGGANPPKAGILVGGQDRNTFENITINGPFTSACIAIISGDSTTLTGGFQLVNWDANAPCLLISNQADWGISSRFATIPQHEAVNDVWLHGGEVHGMGRQQWTTYIRNATHVHFNGTLHDNSGTAHVLMQGSVSYVTSVGQKFYSELGVTSGSVWQCNGTCDHVRVRNAMYAPIPATTIGSTFVQYLND